VYQAAVAVTAGFPAAAPAAVLAAVTAQLLPLQKQTTHAHRCSMLLRAEEMLAFSHTLLRVGQCRVRCHEHCNQHLLLINELVHLPQPVCMPRQFLSGANMMCCMAKLAYLHPCSDQLLEEQITFLMSLW
jgi:hypothetical protein